MVSHNRILITIFAIAIAPIGVIGQVPTTYNECQTVLSCNECIGSEGCVWCSSHELEGRDSSSKRVPRCDTLENHKSRGDGYCAKEENLEISRSRKEILQKNPVNQKQGVHISPQKAKVQLAVGEPLAFEVSYLEDTDKRLDLYYILDLSWTMLDDKMTVADESHTLANELRTLTNKVRFGFGSFVDKPVIPFSSHKQLTTQHQDYVKPYGFKNHLSLTEDISAFQKAVRNSNISANIDMAEGGFDALMQAIVCREEIDWRETETHKLIVIASDGPFHIAGDGKLGGIVEPNDMKCHLNAKGDYTHSTLLDYPSVGQINYVASRSSTYIIFAATDDYFELYEQLSERVKASKAARLRNDSNNVVQLVKSRYNSIKGEVDLNVNAHGASAQLLNYIDIQYSAKCSDGKWKDNEKSCAKVGPGGQVQFKIELKLKKCPPEQRKGELIFTTFALKAVKEEFKIDVELNCECNCSNTPRKFDYDSKSLENICNGNAKRLQCGKCICDEEHSGNNCECSKQPAANEFINRTKCRMEQTSGECSGRGECLCGQCDCSKSPGWGGQYCECDQTQCRLNLNNEFEIECFGQGKCVCGKCHCNPDRGGEKCQCAKEQTSCMEPGSNQICAGVGHCSCNRNEESVSEWDWECVNCNSFNGKYCHLCKGANCQKQSRSQARCDDQKLIECSQCHMTLHLTWSKDGCLKSCIQETDQNASNEILRYDVVLTEFLGQHETESTGACTIPYNETCSMYLLYEYGEKSDRLSLKVTLATVINCLPALNIIPYIAAVAGGVILIGLLTILLWKLFTFIHDTREYRRFEKEREGAKWAKGENPLYSTPMSSFQNPAYRN